MIVVNGFSYKNVAVARSKNTVMYIMGRNRLIITFVFTGVSIKQYVKKAP